MKVRSTTSFQRIAILSTLLIFAVILTVMPRGFGGSLFILSVSVLSGLIAVALFLKNSVKKIKDLAEQMASEYQAKTEAPERLDHNIDDIDERIFKS